MYIIKIPTKANKLHFVLDFLDNLQDILGEYALINCTESPSDDFLYFESDSLYCRELKKHQKYSIDEMSYLDSYQKDHLPESGFTLQEYIDMCLLFELGKIEIVAKKHMPDIIQTHRVVANSIATLEICPDGLNEIHIACTQELLTKLMPLLRQN